MNDEFFSWASRKDIPTRNRHILYDYIGKFKIIPEENYCDSAIQPKQVNGLDESKCSATKEGNVNKCNSMDIDEDKECKVHTKKIKKGEERKQNDVVEGDVRMCDMDSSAVSKSVKKKRSRKKETLSQDSTKMESGSKVLVEGSIAICEDSEMKEQHGKQCVEDIKTEINAKGRKRKGDSKAGSKKNITTLNEDVESNKKRKRSEPNENTICDKHGKKKKKLKNKSVVVEDTNDVAPVENEVKDKLSKEAEVSVNEGSESVNYTFDSLDGSYLGTLPKQAQNVTSFGGSITKSIETTEIFNKEKSPVQDANNTETKITDTPKIDSSTDSLCQFDSGVPADSTAEKATEIPKKENINLSPDSMPLTMFLRHSLKKVKASSEPRTQKERKKIMVSWRFVLIYTVHIFIM